MAFDQQAYYQEHKDKLKAQARAYYQAHRTTPEGRAADKLRRELLHFGVPLSIILRKNKGKCMYCGRKAVLGHHLDEDGRTNERRKSEPGRDADRIVPVCRACHMDLHRAKLMQARKLRAHGYWSRNYDCCVECGRKDSTHCSHGRCQRCCAREHAREKARLAREAGV